MEDAIRLTLSEADKLESQICALLESLQSESIIEESDLLTLPLTTTMAKNAEEVEKRKLPAKKGKGKPLTASERRRKSLEMDSAPIPMDVDEGNYNYHYDLGGGGGPGPEGRVKGPYKMLESSLFLAPVGDDWVLGMTLMNVSKEAQNCPDLILTVESKRNVVHWVCQAFSFKVQVTPLNVKWDAIEARNIDAGIPYQDISDGHGHRKIQPRCQVLVTATFLHPVTFLGKGNVFNFIAVIFLDGLQLFSRSVQVSHEDLISFQHFENVFRVHQTSILSAFGEFKEFFRLSRILPHVDSSPYRAVESFLIPLGFAKISSENTGIDTSMDVFAVTKSNISPLWGSLFKIEKNFRKTNNIRCMISSRTIAQHQTFLHALKAWLEKEDYQDRRKGISSLSISPAQSLSPDSPDDKTVIKAIKEEIETISNLLDWRVKNAQNGFNQHNNSHNDWIRKFLFKSKVTDDILMNSL